jgi:hypothetical protein
MQSTDVLQGEKTSCNRTWQTKSEMILRDDPSTGRINTPFKECRQVGSGGVLPSQGAGTLDACNQCSAEASVEERVLSTQMV